MRKGIHLAGVLAAVSLAAGSIAGCAADPGTTVGVVSNGPAFLASVQPRPNFNLEVILRPVGDGDGFGHVKFRQDNDPALIVNLDTWLRDLAPNRHYRLQRAVDATVDDNCTSATWLTLGKGTAPQDLITDNRGTANEDLFRTLTTQGNEFDIQFRVIDAGTGEVALRSACYQFFVR